MLRALHQRPARSRSVKHTALGLAKGAAATIKGTKRGRTMADDFLTRETGLTSPAVGADVIVPNDTVALPKSTRAIYVGTAGNLRLQFVAGDVVTLTNLQAGVIYPLRATLVLATGTTAGGLVGLR